MNDLDVQWMRRALELAESGRGAVEPNPLVGAVVVRAGQLAGAGWHQRYGEDHAEIHALNQAGEAARGATLYVTLEPCCHHGKTPPCTEAVLRAGIRRVVVAMTDPFPQVSGQGVAQLAAAGMAVDLGLCEAEARILNAPYLKLLATGRPYVHAKWAMSLDGKIATRTGASRWISSAGSRRRVHALRGRMDAILVGIGTVLADDPLLTARPPGPRAPARIILDSQGRLPPTSQLARSARTVPVVVVTSAGIEDSRLEPIRALGCEIVQIPAEQGRPRLSSLLDELGRRRMTSILVEGGSDVLGSFLDAGFIDEVHVFLAPILIGGIQAKTPVAGQGVESISLALKLADLTVEMIEGDVLLHGRATGGRS